MKNEYVIAVDIYPKKAKVNVLGPTTLSVTSEYESKSTMTVYVRGYDNPKEPRLNVKEVAMKLTNKKEANRIAKEITKATFDECKAIARVEKL